MRPTNAKQMPIIRLVLIILLSSSTSLFAQTATHPVVDHSTNNEKRAELNLQAAKANPLQLRHFLLGMPKGADLHNHLGGAVYAESWIRVAAQEHLCIDLQEHSLSQPKTTDASAHAICGSGKVPADQAFKDEQLYDAVVDTYLMRSFVPSPAYCARSFFLHVREISGSLFLPSWKLYRRSRSRAASQNEQYLELMHTPAFDRTAAIAHELGWRTIFHLCGRIF
jgi:adenosine deaminase